VKRPDKRWTATRYKHLYRHKSGIYYARLSIAGKQTWRTLGTEILSVAQHVLSAILQEEERRSELAGVGSSSWSNVGEMMKSRETQIENDASTKSSTKKYWQEIHLALRRSWPELESLQILKETTMGMVTSIFSSPVRERSRNLTMPLCSDLLIFQAS
jgi:hypothetical protein